MIYTSYFGKLRDIPKDVIPIAISLKVPDGVNVYRLDDLAPTYEMLSFAKQGRYEEYEEKYNSEIIDPLDIDELFEEITDIVDEYGGVDAVLLCYEKNGFCHRHIVREALQGAGYECEELV